MQRELKEEGRHRSAGAVDLLVAATAELQGLIMLHHDNGFETIAAVTGRPTQRLAAPGSLRARWGAAGRGTPSAAAPRSPDPRLRGGY